MIKVILDASALLALIKNEPGAAMLEKHLGSTVMSYVNVSEVATILLKTDISMESFKETILPLISTIVPFDEQHALVAASVQKETTQNLSLGDQACLALGRIKKLPIYTLNRAWTDLSLDHIEIRLIDDNKL